MKILVTGGAGFIGSNFINNLYLSKNKYHEAFSEIIVVDSLTYSGKFENISMFRDWSNFTFVKSDIRDKDKIEKYFDDTNIVVNFAAETHVDNSIKNPNIFIETNVLGTQTLLELSRLKKINKFLQVSTDEVYGSIKTGFFDEKKLLEPSSPYSASKASADLICESYFRTFGLNINISRCTNNYGTRQNIEKVIPLFITNLLQGKKIPIYGTGENIREWLHVNDHSEALMKILNSGQPGEVYNIGSNYEISNLQLAQKILNVMNMPKTYIQNVDDRPGHDFRYALDSSKIRNNLNFKPKHVLDEELINLVKWYDENRVWWS
jgi:dTDP-glucose 4,6-dehydratase